LCLAHFVLSKKRVVTNQTTNTEQHKEHKDQHEAPPN
jgi:hypothetical protein